MKRFWLAGICLSLLAACGETDGPVEDTDALDDRDGVIDWERADNNSVVRPGTNEADAVLRYANQPIADAAAGQQFLTELDTELNVLAARNITKARAGADGQFGTADDVVFSTLEQLDEVPWVGRSALQQLFVLAQANGFFQTSVACETVLGTGHITTMAQLIEVENSRCDHFEGSVTLDVRQNLLPMHRNLKAFDNVKRIEGQLTVRDRSRVFESYTFRNLEHVATFNTRYFDVDHQKLSFPALKSIVSGAVSSENLLIETLETVEQEFQAQNYTGTFPNLRTVGLLGVHGTAVTGYEALQEAETVDIHAASFDGMRKLESVQRLRFYPTNISQGTAVLEGFDSLISADEIVMDPSRQRLAHDGSGFAALQGVGTLRFNGGSFQFPALVTAGTIETSTNSATFSGSFGALETADNVNSKAAKFPFPKLKEVTENYTLTDAGTFDIDPSVLKTVGGSMSTTAALCQYTQLESVGGGLYLHSPVGGTWNGMNRLESVGDGITVESDGGSVTGFGALTDVGGSITVYVQNGSVDGFAALTEHDATINLMADAAGNISGFDALESLLGTLTVRLRARDAKFDAMKNLLGVRNLSMVDASQESLNILPNLLLVDAVLNITGNGSEIRGLAKLDSVNGDLVIDNAPAITGLGSLVSVGGQNLTLPREMPAADRDTFLNQLEQFSGTIHYR